MGNTKTKKKNQNQNKPIQPKKAAAVPKAQVINKIQKELDAAKEEYSKSREITQQKRSRVLELQTKLTSLEIE